MAPWKLRRGKEARPPSQRARKKQGDFRRPAGSGRAPAAYAMHLEDRGTLALAAVAEYPPTTAAGELEP